MSAQNQASVPIDDTMLVDNMVRAIANAVTPAGERSPAPFATCPSDGEPLVTSLEVPGAEFLCMVCGARLGFMAPLPATPTPDLRARYEDLRERYKAGERP